MDLGIDGRTYVITGGSAGIGRSTAEQLVREGANVVTCARGEEALARSMREIDPSGERAIGVPLDMTRPEAAQQLYGHALERFGRVDGIVNNVGTSNRGAFADLKREDWQRDLDLKLFSAIEPVRLALPELRARGTGSVINVLSIGGKQPGPGSMPTSVTRGAGLAMTKALSKELAPDNVRVNAVCVGIIRSQQHDRRWQEQAPELTRDQWYAHLADQHAIPLGRAGDPQEMAALIALLLSDLSGFTTGTAINVDGGQAAVL
jgi:3-oxoacyl-[acyl-carrier protein] reductase